MSEAWTDHQEEEHQGERYLHLLGLGHLAWEPIPGREDGKVGRDFLDICGEHALPPLVGFADMSPADPDYEGMKAFLQQSVLGYF